MLLMPAVAAAERAVDYTWVRGAAMGEGYDEPARAVVPPHPSLFVHLGSDGPQGMPRFTTSAGAPIDIWSVTELQSGPWMSLSRVDLAIDEGTIQVWLGDGEEPVQTYVIDPRFVPRTRSVAVRPSGGSLWVESDAVAFRFEVAGGNTIYVSDGPHVQVDEGKYQRVSALYANGREEIIFDGAPTARADPFLGVRALRVGDTQTPGFRIVPVLLAWLALGLFALVRRKTMPAE